MKDPQQEAFTLIRNALTDHLDMTVYDGGLPAKDVPYPFVYLGETTQNDAYTFKDTYTGRISQTIHVWWDLPYKRGTLSDLLYEIKSCIRQFPNSSDHAFYVRGMNQRILADNSTERLLLHGVVEVTYDFIRRSK